MLELSMVLGHGTTHTEFGVSLGMIRVCQVRTQWSLTMSIL